MQATLWMLYYTFSPVAFLLLLSITMHLQWANYFLQCTYRKSYVKVCYMYFLCVCVCVFYEGDAVIQVQITSSRLGFPHGQLPVFYQSIAALLMPAHCSHPRRQSSPSLSVIDCASGHVGNAVNSVLNNDSIILCMWEGERDRQRGGGRGSVSRDSPLVSRQSHSWP